jgi:hypothetical protein
VTDEALIVEGATHPIEWLGPFVFSLSLDGAETLWVFDVEEDGYHQVCDGRPQAVWASVYGGLFCHKHDEDRIPESPRIDTGWRDTPIRGHFQGLAVFEREGEDRCILPCGTETAVRWLNPHCFLAEPVPRDPHMFVFVPAMDAYAELGSWDDCVSQARAGLERIHCRLESPPKQVRDTGCGSLAVMGVRYLTGGVACCAGRERAERDRGGVREREAGGGDQIKWPISCAAGEGCADRVVKPVCVCHGE